MLNMYVQLSLDRLMWLASMSTQDMMLKLLRRLSLPITKGPLDPDRETPRSAPSVRGRDDIIRQDLTFVLGNTMLAVGFGSDIVSFSLRCHGVAGLLSDADTSEDVHVRDKLFAICDDVHEHHASTASIPGIGATVAEDNLTNDLSRDEAGHAQRTNSVNRLIGRQLLATVQEEWTAVIAFRLGVYNAFQFP
jgi:hypothetical protein